MVWLIISCLSAKKPALIVRRWTHDFEMKLREFYEEPGEDNIFNVLGIVASFLIGLIIPMFCIWQWDMIVTGPVWWEASPTGSAGIGWSGGYFRAPFQCFYGGQQWACIRYITIRFVLIYHCFPDPDVC